MENTRNISLSYESSLLGKIALITDSSNSNLSNLDLLEALKLKNLEVTIIDLADPQVKLLNRKIWKGINRVWISLLNDNNIFLGYIQGFLEVLGISYTGTGMLSVALSQDQVKSKKIWQIMGIATTPLVKWKDKFDWQELLGLLGLPLAVRSLNLNDNRVFKITNLEQTKEIPNKFEDLTEIIIEPWITGDEYVVYIINDQTLYPLKVNHDSVNNAKIMINNNLEPEELLNFSSMQKLALDAFLAIGGQGFAAVHIVKDLNGDCWVSSINFGLALTKNSDFAIAAYKSGMTFEELIDQILATSFIKKSNNVLIPTF